MKVKLFKELVAFNQLDKKTNLEYKVNHFIKKLGMQQTTLSMDTVKTRYGVLFTVLVGYEYEVKQ